MRLGAAALIAAVLFLTAVLLQADDEAPLVEPPGAIELGAVGGTNPIGSSSSERTPRSSPEPSWIKHDVDYEDIEGFDDNSGKGSDNSGKGSDNSGKGSDNSGKGSDNSGSGSGDDGGDDS